MKSIIPQIGSRYFYTRPTSIFYNQIIEVVHIGFYGDFEFGLAPDTVWVISITKPTVNRAQGPKKSHYMPLKTFQRYSYENSRMAELLYRD